MLVVIQAGIHRLLQGKDPYAMYQVPWPATLPYGPVMWGPLILPTLAHADIRLATLAGFLFVPCLCFFAAADQWARDRRIASMAWLLVLATLALSPDMRNFVSIGHTPWLQAAPCFAWLVAGEAMGRARLVAGLLIVARSTMVSLAPVLLIAEGTRARPRFARTTALLARVRAAVSARSDPGLARAQVRLPWQLSGRHQRLRLEVDRLGAAHHRRHGNAAVARLGHAGRNRAGAHDDRRLRRLRVGCSRGRRPLPWLASPCSPSA